MAEVRTVDMYKIQKWRVEWEKSGVNEGEEGLTVYKRRKGPEFIHQVETMNVHQQPVAHKTRGRGKQTFKDDMKKSREELVWKRLV